VVYSARHLWPACSFKTTIACVYLSSITEAASERAPTNNPNAPVTEGVVVSPHLPSSNGPLRTSPFMSLRRTLSLDVVSDNILPPGAAAAVKRTEGQTVVQQEQQQQQQRQAWSNASQLQQPCLQRFNTQPWQAAASMASTATAAAPASLPAEKTRSVLLLHSRPNRIRCAGAATSNLHKRHIRHFIARRA
jgi:hypothetical protein